MKSRKKKLADYKDKYSKLLHMEDDVLLHLSEYCEENRIDIEEMLNKARKRAIKILENQTFSTIRITLYEEPFKTERPRVGFYKNIYSPNAKNNSKYMEDQIKKLAKRSIKLSKILSSLISTPSEIHIKAYFPLPSNIKKKHAFEIPLFLTNILKVFRDPDYDNIGKAYTDMLNNLLIYDDKMIYKGTVQKLYAFLPKVEVELKSQSYHDSFVLYEKLLSNSLVKKYQEEGRINLQFLE